MESRQPLLAINLDFTHRHGEKAKKKRTLVKSPVNVNHRAMAQAYSAEQRLGSCSGSCSSTPEALIFRETRVG